MKSRGARFVILATLIVQLLAAAAMGRSLGLGPRNHRSEGIVSSTSVPSASKIATVHGRVLVSDRINTNNDLLSSQLGSGILLNGRNWNQTTSNLRLPFLNPLVSRERFTSNWRAFVVGHLIKNAFHRDAPPQNWVTK